VRCPSDATFTSRAPWIVVAPTDGAREVTCQVSARREGEARLTVSWHDHDGALLGEGAAALVIDPPRAASPDDPMSPDERFAFGVALAGKSLPGARALLAPLLTESRLSPHAVVGVSEALLADARREAEPAALVAAFEAARERSRRSTLDLETAAAVAHAYATTGEPARAVAAARAVLDARFREELGAVRAVQESGLSFVALLLLQELMARYPEGETVIQARYLAPSMLLERAAGDGDRMGYTRTSLRHTAAADLARFLLLHPDHASAPEAAVLLAETLRLLRDPARERALAGPLVGRYGTTPTGWRLAIADARARFATGDLSGAARVLDGIDVEGVAASQVALERGRIAEARGRNDDALEHYRHSSTLEAAQRRAWLERAELDPDPLLVLRRGDRRTVPASLAPGTRVDVSATRIVLEHLLLRDTGDLDPASVIVDGLAAERTATVRADASGELPLPRLREGAWLVSATVDGEPRRFLVLQSDLGLEVRDGHGGDALVQLRDHRGRPVKDASLWVFGHETATATTDALGAAWLPGAAGAPVLARSGESYAYFSPPETRRHHPARRPRAAPPAVRYDFADDAIDGLLQKNVSAYESMYQQERTQTLSTDAF
jgi:tetratricopeptide (TPR) repeat protein